MSTDVPRHRFRIAERATSYLRYDGTSDATTTACSRGQRSQNEPTVPVNPRNTDIVVAGSNDYCARIVNGDVWTGFYLSTNGRAAGVNSLVRDYPDDTSAAGAAPPTHSVCSAAGDPVQSFDTEGRLYYGCCVQAPHREARASSIAWNSTTESEAETVT